MAKPIPYPYMTVQMRVNGKPQPVRFTPKSAKAWGIEFKADPKPKKRAPRGTTR